MSGNALEFALGLQTGGFLSVLGRASSAIQAFTGGLLSFSAVTAGIMDAFEKGAGLEKLHKQTGESVSDLYKLQRGFEECGAGAENVGPAILAMQRALGGTNELGERTVDIFQRMGLSANALKGEGAARQVEQIAAALAKFNSSDASRAASSIFGRQNAATMLSIARSADDFQRAIREAGPQAAVFERVAEGFKKIDALIRSIKDHIGNFFVGFADAITPELTKVLDKIKSFSGKFGVALAEAAHTGQLGELLEDTLEAAFEQGGYYGARVFSVVAIGFGDALGAALTTALMDFVPAYLNSIKNAVKLLASRSREDYARDQYNTFTADSKYRAGIGDKAGALEYAHKASEAAGKITAETAYQNQLLTEGTLNLHAALQSGAANMMAGIAGAIKDISADWKASDDPNAPHSRKDKLNADIARLVKMAEAEPVAAAKPSSKAREFFRSSYTYRPEFNAFEKMGFVMRGGAANPAVEHARRTADNTTKLVTLFEATVQLLENPQTMEGNAP